MPDKHSKYSPSAAHRWLNCPGSLSFSDLQDIPGDAAIMGSKIHELIARMFSGENFEIGTEAETSLGPLMFSKEIYESCKTYMDFVDCKANEFGSAPLIETKIDLDHLFPGRYIFGTADCAIFVPFNHLVIIEYKSGVGQLVEAFENFQLSLYALSYLGKVTDPIPVELCVVQPSAYDEKPVKIWRTTSTEILQLVPRIQHVFDNPNEFSMGEWCKWCRGAHICPEVSGMCEELLNMDPKKDEISPEKISEILKSETAIMEILKYAKQKAFEYLHQNIPVPGFKLVERLSNRSWKDEQAVIDKFGPDVACEMKVLSPSKIEKITREKAWVADNTVRLKNGFVLAGESDKRESITIGFDL